MSLTAGRPSKKVDNTLSLSELTNSPKKTVRVNFNLDEEMYMKLKMHALDSRKTVTQLLTEMIVEKVAER